MNTAATIWKNGQQIPMEQATTHCLTHGLHYGSAVFEGIRFYQTAKGPAVFKLREHMQRFVYSAETLGMSIPYSVEALCAAVLETLQNNPCREGYIRPLAYYGHGSMKVVPGADQPVDVIIACWPWGDYLPVAAVDVATSQYIRIHPKSTVADAKISGHYVNSILAGLAIRNTHYHEALLLDAQGFVAEGSAENIFIVKDNKIITPPVGTILVGITRDMVMKIAADMGIEIEERLFKPEEVTAADEAFFSGTAVEITAIRSLDDKTINRGTVGPLTKKLKTAYHQIVRGQHAAYQDALTWISAKPVAQIATEVA